MLYSPHEVRRMNHYIHEFADWPTFHWDLLKLAPLLATVHQHQGRLQGHMETLGFNLQNEATLLTLTEDVIKNSEIENETLDPHQVRSSIARKLSMDIAGLVPADRHVEGAVEIALDAIQHYKKPLTKERLFNWHAALFPTGRSGMRPIIVGRWRDDKDGPMQVVSGPLGRERVHFEAPAAARIDKEMRAFLAWFNGKQIIDPIIKAGLAHLWFVTIHPFSDGNGRIARTITDLQLARSDNSSQRFYSLSTQIRKERTAYYEYLENTQKDTLDVTDWLEWFLTCIQHALLSTSDTLAKVLRKAHFWEKYNTVKFNDRQRLILNKLFEDFIGKLTSSKWAKITKCSQDTASRDIQRLIDLGILVKEPAGGRSTNYVLAE
jgi:Fic family protein